MKDLANLNVIIQSTNFNIHVDFKDGDSVTIAIVNGYRQMKRQRDRRTHGLGATLNAADIYREDVRTSAFSQYVRAGRTGRVSSSVLRTSTTADAVDPEHGGESD